MAVVVIHLQEIDIVVTAMVGVDVEYPDALNIVVCSLFGTIIVLFLDAFGMLLKFLGSFAVLVSGLPSSASWQDLKVIYCVHYHSVRYFIG